MDAEYKYIYYDDPMSESKRRKRRAKNNNPYSKANVLTDLGNPEWATEELKRTFSMLYCMRISKEQKKILNAKYGEINCSACLNAGIPCKINETALHCERCGTHGRCSRLSAIKKFHVLDTIHLSKDQYDWLTVWYRMATREGVLHRMLKAMDEEVYVMPNSPTNNTPDSQHVRTVSSWDVKQDYRPSADQNDESCVNQEYKSNAHYEYGFRATYPEWQPMFDYYSNQKSTTRPSNENQNDSIVSTYASSNSSVDRNHSSLSSCDYREEVDEDVVHPNMHPTPSSDLLEGPFLYHKRVSVGFSSNQRPPFLDPLLESSKDRLYTSSQQHSYESHTQLEVLDRSNDAYNYDRQTPNMRRKPLPSYLNIPKMYDNECDQSFDNVIGSCITSNDSRVSTQSDNVHGCEASADEGDQVYTL